MRSRSRAVADSVRDQLAFVVGDFLSDATHDLEAVLPGEIQGENADETGAARLPLRTPGGV
jgi:hypothetical protein